MAVFVGVFGALIGSFLNVVAYRVPLRLSIVSPPSACPHCSAPIRGYDNMPVISWLVLRGKCRDCQSPISARYPLVEAGTAVFFTVVALWFWPNVAASGSVGTAAAVAAGLAFAAFLYLAAVSVALALIDIDTHTLPNRIVLPSFLVGVVLLGAAAVLGSDVGALIRAAIGSAALFLAYAAMAFAYPGGMGLGDVKLAGVLGLFLGYLGWGQLVVGAFGAFIIGGVFALGLVIFRRANRKTGIPFGPWMLAGAWLGALVGAPISLGYLALFGLA
ncbi:prepilin peptidase [Lacisediminihabitans profunda]|uniref:prepilin peptidase n=1 Tax=Lacisediminihabitans profunda TaxID=2594790 RepID=UPI001FE2B4B3|nr:A24 family peptidase [Lacisediminihabitans profunda]